MQILTNTPQSRNKYALYLLFMFFIWPIVEYYEILFEYQNNVFDNNADSLIIPIMGFLVGWVILLPIVSVLIYFTYKKYIPAISIFQPTYIKVKFLIVYFLVIIISVYDIVFFILNYGSISVIYILYTILQIHSILYLSSQLVNIKFFK
ncbi:MAG: hypothetical protein GXX85_04145 [Ignavibacteria bacterium]|nr:hypothetical protein [Ignavibacteria bacterium]